jgi:hypothetical protein
MNEPNMPKPTSSAARLVARTAGSRMRPMSTSGSRRRDSTTIQTTASTAAVPKSARVRAEPQPQAFAWLTPSSSATSAPDSSPAPSQSILAGERTGDSGTHKRVATIATRISGSASQKSHS